MATCPVGGLGSFSSLHRLRMEMQVEMIRMAYGVDVHRDNFVANILIHVRNLIHVGLRRLRAKIVQNRTDYKNRVRKVLQRCDIRLGSKLSRVFGKASSCSSAI